MKPERGFNNSVDATSAKPRASGLMAEEER